MSTQARVAWSEPIGASHDVHTQFSRPHAPASPPPPPHTLFGQSSGPSAAKQPVSISARSRARRRRTRPTSATSPTTTIHGDSPREALQPVDLAWVRPGSGGSPQPGDPSHSRSLAPPTSSPLGSLSGSCAVLAPLPSTAPRYSVAGPLPAGGAVNENVHIVIPF